MARTLRTLCHIWIVAFVLPCILAEDLKRDPSINENKNSEPSEEQSQSAGRFGLRSRPSKAEKGSCGGEQKGQDDFPKDGSPKPKIFIAYETINDAQKVWAAAKQAQIDQLEDQIKDDESAVNDEAAALVSVQRCVETASAAGSQARSQAKIVNMLQKNSKELIDHLDHIEHIAEDELATTEERVMKYKEKLSILRIKVGIADKELVAIQRTGVLKPLCRLRRLENRRLGQRFGTIATSKQRFMNRMKRASSDEITPTDEAGASPTASKKETQPSEAQLVWIAAKQALINQMEEQIREIESAIGDEAVATESVQKCIQTSLAAALEARQQSKIIQLLTKNSKELIEHIDAIEQIANGELDSTEVRLGRFKLDLEKLRDRMSAAQQELLQIQDCGKVKPLKALRRQNVLKEKASVPETSGDAAQMRKRRDLPMETSYVDTSE